MSWKACRLGDVMTLKRGHDLPEHSRQKGDVPVVSSSGITGRHKEAKATAPGVVTGRYGTIGEVYFLQEDFWPLNTALYVIDFKGNDPRFTSYFLRNVLTGYQSEKAAIPGVDRNVLHEIKVRLPSLPEQLRITEILSAYDDLIDNNSRRMALLEDSARQLYREWFVRLRFPGHEHTPIVDGVPQGWSKVKVGSMLLKGVKAKKIQKGKYLENGAIPCIDQGSNFIGGYTDDEEARIFEPLPLIIFGDHTRVLKYVNFPFAVGADGTQVIAPNTPCMTVEYLYYALKAANISNHFYARHFKFLKEEIVMVPTEQLMREFSNIGKSGFDQINSLRTQNQKLRQARDLLLPRLMNGELAV